MADKIETREEAIAYLKRKDIEATEEEIDKVMKDGRIYGDPVFEIEF